MGRDGGGHSAPSRDGRNKPEDEDLGGAAVPVVWAAVPGRVRTMRSPGPARSSRPETGARGGPVLARHPGP